MKFFTILTVFALTSAYKITQMNVPLYADPRRAADLGCHFQMENEILHSVKWYRDLDEILRYNPSQKPPIRFFNVTGVTVQGGYCQMNRCIVHVIPLPVPVKAAYTCEVSTEGPKFQIARQTRHMTVAAMPERDPVIIGAPKVVKPGEKIFLNCTSDYSQPPAGINWYIDDELQKQEPWQPTELGSPQTGDLRGSWRVLHVAVPEAENGSLRVRCEAAVPLDPPVLRDTSIVLTPDTQPDLPNNVANTGTTKGNNFFIVLVTLTYMLIQLAS